MIPSVQKQSVPLNPFWPHKNYEAGSFPFSPGSPWVIPALVHQLLPFMILSGILMTVLYSFLVMESHWLLQKWKNMKLKKKKARP